MSAVHVNNCFYFILSQCITLLLSMICVHVLFYIRIVLHSHGYIISYLYYLCILVSNTYCTNVVSFFFCLGLVHTACVASFSGLSLLDCPFGIL